MKVSATVRKYNIQGNHSAARVSYCNPLQSQKAHQTAHNVILRRRCPLCAVFADIEMCRGKTCILKQRARESVLKDSELHA